MKDFDKTLKKLHEQKINIALKLYEYEQSAGTLSPAMLLLSIEKITDKIQKIIKEGRNNDSASD